jgi:hypothetical protein
MVRGGVVTSSFFFFFLWIPISIIGAVFLGYSLGDTAGTYYYMGPSHHVGENGGSRRQVHGERTLDDTTIFRCIFSFSSGRV